MTAIRTLGYSALVLAAFSGCSQEPATTTTTPPAETTKPDTVDIKPVPAPEGIPSGEMKGAPAPAPTDAPKIEAPQPTPATKDEAKDKSAEAAPAPAALAPEEVAEVKKLPGGESELALKQKVCPVSGENLGSMGVPLKVTAEGQTFYLCCDGCKKEVKNDPAAVVAKLKK
jgi:YHS domain-containing protein